MEISVKFDNLKYITYDDYNISSSNDNNLLLQGCPMTGELRDFNHIYVVYNKNNTAEHKFMNVMLNIYRNHQKMCPITFNNLIASSNFKLDKNMKFLDIKNNNIEEVNILNTIINFIPLFEIITEKNQQKKIIIKQAVIL